MVVQLICPLCSHVFTDPTAAVCGHVFCKKCISAFFRDSPYNLINCPECATPNISKFDVISLSLVKEVNYPEEPPLGKWQLPLHHAAFTGNLGEVRKLVNSGMDLYIRSGDDTPGYCPIHLASMSGSLGVVKFLIERSPSLKFARSISHGELPIHTAASNGQAEVVRHFIQNGTDLNFRCTAKGRTILHFCCERGHFSLAQWLLKLGADATAKTNTADGENTPIHVASANGNLDIVKLFIDKDQKLALVQNGDGELPLHKAAASGNIEIVEFFVNKKKMKVDSRCAQSKRTALMTACENGNLKLVEFLIGLKADIKAKDKNGDTSLHWAALNGHIQVVKRLLQLSPVMINIKDNDGDSPLNWAQSGTRPDCVRVVQILS